MQHSLAPRKITPSEAARWTAVEAIITTSVAERNNSAAVLGPHIPTRTALKVIPLVSEVPPVTQALAKKPGLSHCPLQRTQKHPMDTVKTRTRSWSSDSTG